MNEDTEPKSLIRSRTTRRAFLRAGAAMALTAATWRRAYGANERIGVGLGESFGEWNSPWSRPSTA